MKGFILAAGEGVRLRPLTNYLPKPLLSVLNQPMIYYAIKNLRTIDIKVIVANTYYKKDILRTYLMEEKIFISEEDILLGTAGGLGNAKKFLLSDTDDKIILHNSDVITNIDLRKLLDAHNQSNSLITMALYDYPEINTVCIDADLNIISFNPPKKEFMDFNYYTYTGIAVIEKKLIEKFPFNKYGDLTTYLKDEIKNQIGSVKGYLFSKDKYYWYDCGTINNFYLTNKFMFENYSGNDYRFIKTNNYFSYKSFMPKDTVFKGFNIIGKNVSIDNNITLENTIILDNAKIQKGLVLKNSIVGDNYILCNNSSTV